MIRRDLVQPAQAPAWVLISQIEHARLAGDLARHWGTADVAALTPFDELLAAIYHHDDGWAEWEMAPQVNPQSGRPLEFLEMPLGEALGIWRRSIDRCALYGPLAAWVVAGHFDALLRSSAVATAPEAMTWLDEFDARRASWLAETLAREGRLTLAEAATALRTLQFFDRLSLWFCCAARSQPARFTLPGGSELKIIPQPADTFELNPWPLSITHVDVEVAGEQVAATYYGDAAALAVAPRTRVTFRWRLRPA